MPDNMGKVFFTNAGAESNENAVKIARAYTGRPGLITFGGGFHGRTFMTMALIPLACLPELRLTDRGLVDCTTFSFADLEVE